MTETERKIYKRGWMAGGKQGGLGETILRPGDVVDVYGTNVDERTGEVATKRVYVSQKGGTTVWVKEGTVDGKYAHRGESYANPHLVYLGDQDNFTLRDEHSVDLRRKRRIGFGPFNNDYVRIEHWWGWKMRQLGARLRGKLSKS